MIGRTIRFTVRPPEDEAAALLGKPCRYIGPAGDLVALGTFRGFTYGLPTREEVEVTRCALPWPFLMFDGFRVPTSGNTNAPELLEEIVPAPEGKRI